MLLFNFGFFFLRWRVKNILEALKGPITQKYLEKTLHQANDLLRKFSLKTQLWARSSGSHSCTWGIWIYLIENIRALQQHVVVVEWQNVGANLFPVCVPCVRPLPSVSRCHMTGRCVAVINPQITTHRETEFCHSSPQAEQSGTGMCYSWQDGLRLVCKRFYRVLVYYCDDTQW